MDAYYHSGLYPTQAPISASCWRDLVYYCTNADQRKYIAYDTRAFGYRSADSCGHEQRRDSRTACGRGLGRCGDRRSVSRGRLGAQHSFGRHGRSDSAGFAHPQIERRRIVDRQTALHALARIAHGDRSSASPRRPGRARPHPACGRRLGRAHDRRSAACGGVARQGTGKRSPSCDFRWAIRSVFRAERAAASHSPSSYRIPARPAADSASFNASRQAGNAASAVCAKTTRTSRTSHRANSFQYAAKTAR